MPFPDGWPPQPASGAKTLRVRITGTATANFDDNAFLWIDQTSANPFTPTPVIEPGGGVSKPGYTGPHDIGTSPSGSGVDSDGNKGSIWCNHLVIENLGGVELEFSFDGTNIHGTVPAGTRYEYSDRLEAGVAVRGATSDFIIEAW